MKKNVLLILSLILMISGVSYAKDDGYISDSPLRTAFVGVTVNDYNDTYWERKASQNVYITGVSSDTKTMSVQPRVFDSQSFVYINNATASDSVLISFIKTGEIKVFEGETYTATLVKYGINGDTETSTGLIGKLKNITYTKP